MGSFLGREYLAKAIPSAALVEGLVAAGLPPTSLFGSLQEASAFFERGSLGYSVTARPGQFDGLELRSFHSTEPRVANETIL